MIYHRAHEEATFDQFFDHFGLSNLVTITKHPLHQNIDINCNFSLQGADIALDHTTLFHHLKLNTKTQINASTISQFKNKLAVMIPSQDGIHWLAADHFGNIMLIDQKTNQLVQKFLKHDGPEGVQSLIELKNGLLVEIQDSTYTLVNLKSGQSKRLSFLEGKLIKKQVIILPEGDALVYETVDNPNQFTYSNSKTIYGKMVILKQIDLQTGTVKSTHEVYHLNYTHINFMQQRFDRLSNGDIISSVHGIKALYAYDQGKLIRKAEYFYSLMPARDYSDFYQAPNHSNAVVYFDESASGEGTWLTVFDTRELGKPQKNRADHVKLSGSYAMRKKFTVLRDSPSGNQILGGSKDGDAVVWNAETGDQIAKLNCFTSSHVTAIAGSSDLLFVGGGSNALQIWKNSLKVASLKIPNARTIRDIKISDDQTSIRVTAEFEMGESEYKPSIVEDFFAIKYEYKDPRYYYSKVFTWNLSELKSALE